MSEKKIKRIPYGIADFEKIQGKNLYFVDKTGHIPLLEEEGDFLFLIRPRRFGKSLWLSILESYYDIAKKDKFKEFFGGTYIGSNPTEERNSYLLLTFNFSLVNPDIDLLEESFEMYTKIQIDGLFSKYRQYFDDQFIKEISVIKKSADRLNKIFQYVQEHNIKLYLLIDEYDNFANTILSTQGMRQYQALTHGEGFFRYFFNVLKGGTTGSGAGLSKLFITGVSPLTMDDVTSGFNIGNNISLDEKFHAILGFTAHEVKEALNYYQNQGKLKDSNEELYAIMEPWYNNYRFSREEEKKVFNTDMVLYFLNKTIGHDHIPIDLIDQNIKTDYKKLRHLIVMDKQINGNFSRIKEVIENEEISGVIKTSFPAEGLLNPDNFVSLLFYLGLLTIDRYEAGTTILKVPNLTIKTLFYEYMREAYREVEIFKLELWKLAEMVRQMAFYGKWEEVFKYLSDEINKQTSVRDYLNGEKIIQGFLLAYLNITDYFIIRTEYEMGKGYVDLYCEPFVAKYPDIQNAYLIELKYIKREEYTENILKTKLIEAEAQLKRYAADTLVTKSLGPTTLKKLVLVFSGWEMVCCQEVC